MLRTIILSALLVCAAACGPATTEPVRANAAGAAHDGSPLDTVPIQVDTTQRGGGTIGSGT
jgi:hypothetical protein